MKTKLLLASLLAAITAPLHADVLVESNLTIALKMYFNQAPEVETPKITTRKSSLATLKNVDLINAWARVNGGNFTKKAKLIKADLCEGDNFGNIINTKYYIRDNGVDTDITAAFDITIGEEIKNYKRNNLTGTETGTYLSIMQFVFEVEGPNFDDENIDAQGLVKNTEKIIKYQDQFAKLRASSVILTGDTYFQSTQTETEVPGIVQGTFKTTAPKAVDVVP